MRRWRHAGVEVKGLSVMGQPEDVAKLVDGSIPHGLRVIGDVRGDGDDCRGDSLGIIPKELC